MVFYRKRVYRFIKGDNNTVVAVPDPVHRVPNEEVLRSRCDTDYDRIRSLQRPDTTYKDNLLSRFNTRPTYVARQDALHTLHTLHALIGTLNSVTQLYC